jgi:hypothetical protein
MTAGIMLDMNLKAGRLPFTAYAVIIFILIPFMQAQLLVLNVAI